ncbi:ABC transporter ATP-binding protein [Gordonia sp. X0973]|uniref:ABC transporter ATP-binding protein n=1 Tax=Gordonia sp. X0973 TaxID=2742602 RepID=UPI000F537E31|nr:ABC transporter ATP-binding protein [Gordonia sp. X0973]QKT06455.1 ABC transporter ATP-binding protein [Gordonia sp. X0973]
MTAPVAVRCESVTVRRGSTVACDDVTLHIGSGSITGLFGPSGCGKTTLMRSIVGTQAGVKGTIEVLGQPAGAAALRRRVGYATQAASTYSDLTVIENVAYFAALTGSGANVAQTLDAVGLAPYAKRRAADLSGGQINRVSIACALVAKPELLILDEPTVGLDPVLRAELWQYFATLAAAGTTLLVSSHVMDEAEHCDEMILMRDGKVLSQCTPAELKSRTRKTSIDDAFLALIEQGGDQ